MPNDIKFKELDFLKSYIAKCIDLRKKSKKEMEKTVVNSVFGRTMENLRKRVHVEVVIDNPKRIMKLHAIIRSSLNYQRQLAAVKVKVKKIVYDRPIYVGFSILELSKLWMFRMHYDFVKSKLPDSVLMYTDTNSLIYYNPSASLEKFVELLKDRLDTSNINDIVKPFGIEPDHNKIVPGMFKLESPNESKFERIEIFHAAAPKM
jgi:hypothetical protein